MKEAHSWFDDLITEFEEQRFQINFVQMPMAPMNKWVARTLYVIGGYVLKIFLDASAADKNAEAHDDEGRPLPSSRRRRSQIPLQLVAPGGNWYFT